ncbi:unnamed protein product [Ostreobium quekettii]|uniref:OTU domain-containing protein n=1 Tax=Ostreobium quekettii TaxID=121088 RepID=A0A8S1IXW7_9CHLO|nr:unnamed protein product [Ostreobium quekettii]
MPKGAKGRGRGGKGKKAGRGKAGGEGGQAAGSAGKNKDWKKGRKWKKDLEDDLLDMGLRVKHVEPDGNCFFRALGDQIEGDISDHRSIRAAVVQYIEDHRPEFEPFIEDDEDFEDYCSRMREGSTWAGHLEVQAASLLYKVDINIFQHNAPSLCNKNATSVRTVHLSYHDNDHYNSVRLANDFGRGRPVAVELQADGAKPGQENTPGSEWGPLEEKIVAENTGCKDSGAVRLHLEACGGDVDRAVERIISWMNSQIDKDEQPSGSNGKCMSQKADAGGVDGGSGGNGNLLQEESTLDAAALEAHVFNDELPLGSLFVDESEDGVRVEDAENAEGAEDADVENTELTEKAQNTETAKREERKEGGVEGDGKGGEKQSPKAANGGPSGRSAKGNWNSKPSNNKPCPCGSRRKYKNCCKTRDLARIRRQRAREEMGIEDGGADEKRLSMLYI